MQSWKDYCGNTQYSHFVFNGKEYPVGCLIKKSKSGISHLNFKHNKNAFLSSYYINGYNGKKYWVYITGNGQIGDPMIYTTSVPPEKIIDCVLSYPIEPKTEYRKDSEVPEVIVGWFIYVLTMFFSCIFKGFAGLWIGISIYFFNWRKNKLKKSFVIDYDIFK